MISNTSGLLIFLTICGIVASSPDRAIDCRKFVFAPLCRGVAAKRGNLQPVNMEREIYIDGKSLEEFLRNLYSQAGVERLDEENDEQLKKAINKQEIGENVPIKYQQERDDTLHKLLARSRNINSEGDNIPFYANL